MIEYLLGKVVDVTANSITYTGRLVEIGETEIYLESDLGWILIPMEQIASVQERED
jgi:hypothetical protein